MKSKLLTKKSILILLFTMIVLTALSFVCNATIVRQRLNAMAYEKEYESKITGDGLFLIEFKPDSNGDKVGEIGYYIGKNYNLNICNIPSSYNGVYITEISEEAFTKCVDLKKIIIPQSVNRIKSKAFYDCHQLEEIYIPSSVKEIEKNAFFNDNNFTMYVEKSSYAEEFAVNNKMNFQYYTPKPIGKENKKYPKTVNEESDGEFTYSIYYYNDTPRSAIINYNTMIEKEKVTLPQEINGVAVENVADEAFVYCSNIKRIVLPDSIISVGTNAFSECSSLEEVYFTDNIISIGADIFSNSPNAVIFAPKGSYAEKYAVKNGIKCKNI